MKLPAFQPVKTWGATKISAFAQCPLKLQLERVLYLCPKCFKGSVPRDGVCSKCGKKPVKPEALARGIALDEALTTYMQGHAETRKPSAETLLQAVQHPIVRKIADGLRKATKGLQVFFKRQISLDSNWNLLPKFTKGPWFWGELDVLTIDTKAKTAKVIDWKSGGINKKTGEIYAKEEYDDQLEIYGVVTLIAHPEVVVAKPSLVFLDAQPPHDPVVKKGDVLRSTLKKLTKKWEGKVKPMMTAEGVGGFPPRPGWYCGWDREGERQGCPYEKQKGGPCQY